MSNKTENALNNALLGAGSYKEGQLLNPPNEDGVFTAYNGMGPIGGVCAADIELSTVGRGSVCRGEFNKDEMVTLHKSLEMPFIIDDALIARCYMAGIYLN